MNHSEIINEARTHMHATLNTPDYEQEKAYSEIGSIWQDNIRIHLDDIINNSADLEESFTRLNRHTFYDINFGPRKLIEASVKWRLNRYQSHAGRAPLISESPLICDDRCVIGGGHRLSPDLIWRLSILKRLTQSIPFPDEPFTILEIGGGYGAFSRIIKSLYSQCRYIIVDLPHSLFFAYCFLKHAFPGSRHQFVIQNTSPDLSSADFVYLPHKWLDQLASRDFFLVVNTNSFGEMPHEESCRYIRFIQESIQANYLFSLNRLLNRINDVNANRVDCVGHAFQYDRAWLVLDWEVDPDYERCPFLSTLLTRNLHLIMKRETQPANGHANGATRPSLEEIELEDWNTGPYWDNYHLHLGGELGKQYPPIMTRADRELTQDLSMNGTLFNLWNNHRLSATTAPTSKLIIRYLAHLGGIETPFEEFYYFVNKLTSPDQKRLILSNAT